MAENKQGGTVKIKWVRSFIGCPRDMRQTIRGLGFRRMQQVVERADTPAIRGMVAQGSPSGGSCRVSAGLS